MNIWIIGDLHIGNKKGNKIWDDIHQSWMNDFVFPLMEKEKQDNDILIQLGDVYDNRETVANVSLNRGIEFFEKCSKLFNQTYILLGNHDIYGNFSNDIHSVRALEYIPKVKVVSNNYEIFEHFGKKLAIFSWYPDKQKEKRDVNKVDADYIFGHFETSGIKFNHHVMMDESKFPLSLTDFPEKSLVFSGHIHHTKQYENYYNCGNIFEMDWSDAGNEKGIWKLNTETNEVTFYENKVSPKFKSVDMFDMFLMNENELVKRFYNSHLEIMVDISVKYFNLTETLMEYLHSLLKPIKIKLKNYKKEKEKITLESVNSNYVRKAMDIDEAIRSILSKDEELDEVRMRLILDLSEEIFATSQDILYNQ